MWRLRVGKGGDDGYLHSTNDYVGRQIWEFDPDVRSQEELDEVEEARRNFSQRRARVKASSDLIWRLQFLREKNIKQKIPKVAKAALTRGVHYFSALQADDGHWPAENAGPLFFLPPFVSLYVNKYNLIVSTFSKV
ncbi:PREDICTED: germanicol synthase-like [Tarenaya hassleriana]|uniref:germanicol synthase-like n=1 Tax=Tarenaya hassleriana TaxID=28532 RepID=UPI00053C33D2|nr:PREDICTED: germanicol synthase-like [Tarenaya hassleriana]